MSSTNNAPVIHTADTDNFLTVRLLYHLWRVDSAARAFPRHLVNGGASRRAKARWTIGLTLEMHGLRETVADVALLGAMTESLSTELAKRISWFDMGNWKQTAINWDMLPNDELAERVPSPPWIFSYEPHLHTVQNRWWEDNNDTTEKPDWWDNPDPNKWLNHVALPRTLVGEYLTALKDSKEALAAMSGVLSRMYEPVMVDALTPPT